MGTTSEKLTYLNGTKQELKQKINNLGGSIDDNTTFRNYANQLQTIYDNLPKTEYQEGTEVNLGKTIKGKLDYDNGVVGIGQTSQETTEGYNLLDISNANVSDDNTSHTKTTTGYNITTTSQASAVAYGRIVITTSFIDSAKTYGFSFDVISNVGGNMLAGWIGAGKNTSNTLTANEKRHIFGTFSGISTTAFSLAFYMTSATITVENLQIFEGSTDKSYEPYTNGASPNPSYPQTINSVTGNQDVVVSGKNLFDKDNANIINSYFLQTDPTISASGNSYRSIYIECKPNTTYTVSKIASARFCIGYTNTTPTAGVSVLGATQNNTATSITITTGSNAKYLVAFIYHASYDTLAPQQILDSIMICEGTDTTYEPYITPKSYQLSLGDIELNAIGNYKDELIYDVENDRVYKNEKIIKNVVTSTYLDSLINFMLHSINSYGIANFLLLQAPEGETPFIAGVGISNYFSEQTTIIANTQTDGILYQATNIYIRINQNIAKTKTELKNYVDSLNTNGNPLIFYQVVVTPQEIPITDTTLINQVKALYNAHSLNGTTIITSNGDLPLIIKCRALKGGN